MKIKPVVALLILTIFAVSCQAQKAPSRKPMTQDQLIPAELGSIRLGMSLKELGKAVDLSRSEVTEPDPARFEIQVPFSKGSVRILRFNIAGLGQSEIDRIAVPGEAQPDDALAVATREIRSLDPTKIGTAGTVSGITVIYDPSFDLKAWSVKHYGPADRTHGSGDKEYLYDSEWVKTASDLTRVRIRAFDKTLKSLSFTDMVPSRK